MKKLMILMAMFLLSSCSNNCGENKNETTTTTTTTINGWEVEKLFEIDGCAVYRFGESDEWGHSKYFTTCQGSVDYLERRGKRNVYKELPTAVK